MITPALETLYATWGWGRFTMKPDMEAMLTIAPQRAAIIDRPKT